MKRFLYALVAVAAATGSAAAADLAARPYAKAPIPTAVASWTGFYVFGGGGGGLWVADSNVVVTGVSIFGPPGTALSRDMRVGGSGWFGTVGGGYDWQVSNWVAGVFADGQFGELQGSLTNHFADTEGRETLRTSYAAGVRLGYLVAPNVLSYVNAGYSGSEWSGTTQNILVVPKVDVSTTPSFHRNGWFIGGGVENNLSIFGIAAPGWFMKTEYRSTFYNRTTLPETFVPAFGGTPTGNGITFKPWTQTVSTALVYRFNSGATTESAARPYYTKAPMPAPVASWTGLYAFGGGGGGLWNGDGNAVPSPGFPLGTVPTRDQRYGGSGWFGTVGAGYDRQLSVSWVAGVFADGQFGDIRGSVSDPFFDGGGIQGQVHLRASYAAGVRLGYLVASNVLSYANAGYSGSEWSGATLVPVFPGGAAVGTTPSFHRDGWFVGGGVENSLNILGVTAPGWFMKTEYRSAFYDRVMLSETATSGRPNGSNMTLKPWVQTISTSLVYRFNSPVVAKY